MSPVRATTMKFRVPIHELVLQQTVSSTMYISVLFVIVLSYSKLIDYGALCEPLNFLKGPHLHYNNNANKQTAIGPQPPKNHHHDGQHPNSNNRPYQHRHQIHHHRRQNPTQAHGGVDPKQERRARAVYLAYDPDSRGRANSSILGNFNTNPAHSNYHQNDQPNILDQCCACDEAKYELVFEGLWSRYTHPDDFPENYWLAHFSDIIGASHSNEFRMWSQDSYATEGVKELAETGSTRKLESELKLVSAKTRTIIKARELRYPTLNSKTSAVFRTDRLHHLVSILSKLGPSPDWMVGISGLELCQPDCSWAGQRVVNLFLWDAGTDSGTSFTSADSPTRPQERIHPFRKVAPSPKDTQTAMTTRRPEFGSVYESTSYQKRSTYEQLSGAYSLDTGPEVSYGEQSKPYARLTITRQRIYEKSCGIENQTSSTPSYYPTAPSEWPETTTAYSDCRVTDWSDWSTCTTSCGKGLRSRIRSFVDESANSNVCPGILLIEREICISECIRNTTCVTKDWSEWSKCSVSCGQGYRKRTRALIGPMRKVCESVIFSEKESCTGPLEPDCREDPPAQCEVTDWSPWSNCSVSCGKGIRHRNRRYLRKESAKICNIKLTQKQPCTGKQGNCRDSRSICNEPVDPGQCQAKLERWHFDKTRGMCVRFIYGGCFGNRNNFHCFQDCERTCIHRDASRPNPNSPVIDCKLSRWGPWSTCSATCGQGERIRSRTIEQLPKNGGKPCNKRLMQTQKCKDLPPCQHSDYRNLNQQANAQTGPTTRRPMKHDQNRKHAGGAKVKDLRSTSTTQASWALDDEDEKFLII